MAGVATRSGLPLGRDAVGMSELIFDIGTEILGGDAALHSSPWQFICSARSWRERWSVADFEIPSSKSFLLDVASLTWLSGGTMLYVELCNLTRRSETPV
jgi:hypothetical protein